MADPGSTPDSPSGGSMALTVTNWALTTFQGQVVEAYKEADILGMPAIYRFDPGQANGLFPKIANRTVTNRADGTELTASNTTETAATISFDLTESVEEMITYHQVRAYNTQAPQQYAKSFGRQIAQKNQDNLIAHAINVATESANLASGYKRSDGNGEITFNNEDTTGAEQVEAIFDALSQLRSDKVPDMGIIGVLPPTQFYRAKKRPEISSRDYSGNKDLTKPFDYFDIGNARIYCLNSVFGSDLSADTAYATKYRGDFTTVHGVFWHNEALAVREAERPNGQISDETKYDSWLIKARCIRGMGALQPTAFVALIGDNGS